MSVGAVPPCLPGYETFFDSWTPACETVSQFIFSVISTPSAALRAGSGRNPWFKKINYLRFLTFVRNDIFGYCDTVSAPE